MSIPVFICFFSTLEDVANGYDGRIFSGRNSFRLFWIDVELCIGRNILWFVQINMMSATCDCVDKKCEFNVKAVNNYRYKIAIKLNSLKNDTSK